MHSQKMWDQVDEGNAPSSVWLREGCGGSQPICIVSTLHFLPVGGPAGLTWLSLIQHRILPLVDLSDVLQHMCVQQQATRCFVFSCPLKPRTSIYSPTRHSLKYLLPHSMNVLASGRWLLCCKVSWSSEDICQVWHDTHIEYQFLKLEDHWSRCLWHLLWQNRKQVNCLNFTELTFWSVENSGQAELWIRLLWNASQIVIKLDLVPIPKEWQ